MLDPRLALERPRIRPGRLLLRVAALWAASSLCFAYLESYLHWRQGLGWHGIDCLIGPVHRNAIPILGALSLLAVALRLCAEHVVAWARRTIRRLLARTTATSRARRAAAASARNPDPGSSPLPALPPAGPASTPGGAAVVIVTEGERHEANPWATPGARRPGRLRGRARGRSGCRIRARADQPARLGVEELQLYSLAVPTEKENLTTRKIVLTVPSGFGIDSFVPAPGWRQQVQSTGSGEEAVVQKVTWTGGSTPTGRTPCSSSSPSRPRTGSTRSRSQQTYSDGSIVNWNGSESLRQPGADDRGEEHARWRRYVDARDHRPRARRDRSRAGLRRAVRRRRKEAARMRLRGRVVLVLAAVAVALVGAGTASAHAYLVKTVPSASGVLNGPPSHVALTFDEAVEPRFAIISVTDAAGHQVTTHAVTRSPANPDTLVVPLRPGLPGGLVSRLLAGDLRRRPPRPERVHLRRRPERGPPAAVRRPEDLRVRDHAPAAGRPLGDVPDRDGGDRPVRPAHRDRQAARPACSRLEPAPGLDRVRGRARSSGWSRSPSTSTSRPRSTRCARRSRSGRSCRSTASPRSAADTWTWRSASRSSASRAGSRVWIDRPEREQRSIAEILAGIGALLAAAAVARRARRRGPRRTDGAPRPLGPARLAPSRLRLPLDRRPGRPAGGLGDASPPGAGSPGWRSASLDSPTSPSSPSSSSSAPASVRPSCTCRSWPRSGRPPTARRFSSRSGCSRSRCVLGAVNLLIAKPRLAAAGIRADARPVGRLVAARDGQRRDGAPGLRDLRRGGPVQPRPACRARSRRRAPRSPRVGPGRVAATVHKNGYTLQVLVNPNKAVVANSFALKLTKNGVPVRGADVTLGFAMLDMQMADQEYQLTEKTAGRSTPIPLRRSSWSATGHSPSTSPRRTASRSPP